MGYCIRLAYGLTYLREYELVGPRWLDPPTDFTFDIEGKCDNPVTPEQIKLMLQTLLANRFRLAVHRETRNIPVYVLKLGSRDIRLKRSAADTKRKISGTSEEYIFQHVSMPELAMQLGPPYTSRPTIDMTGIKGSFDFVLDLHKYLDDPATGKVIKDANGRIDEGPALIRAVHDQLGLDVKTGRAPISVLVVDHVEKSPRGPDQ